MLTKIKDKSAMSSLRDLYPDMTGDNIIHMVNSAIITKEGKLLVEEEEYEDVLIGKHEMVVKCSLKNEGQLLMVEEMYLRM